MKASAIEFRFRYLIHAVVYCLGFTTPWNAWLHLDTVRTWQWLASWPARAGWMSFSASTNAVLLLGILFALAGAALRTWGAAYLGSGVVQDSSMHGDRVVAAGPYRYMRNPLYLGTFLHTFALALADDAERSPVHDHRHRVASAAAHARGGVVSNGKAGRALPRILRGGSAESFLRCGRGFLSLQRDLRGEWRFWARSTCGGLWCRLWRSGGSTTHS